MLLRASLLCLLGITVIFPTYGQTRASGEGEPSPVVPIRRIALLPLAAPAISDPLVQKLLAQSHADQDCSHRKRTLQRTPVSGQTSTLPTLTLPVKPLKKPTVDPAESLSPAQLTALSDLFFADALSQRLQSRYKITVIDPIQVDKALADLHLTPEQASRPADAQKLCTRLDCDAILSAAPAKLQVREAQTRDLTLRFTLHVAALRDPNSAVAGVKHGKGVVKPGPIPQSNITVAGSASIGHAFMHAAYAKTLPVLAKEAASQAAALAIHSLSTGEIAPFMQPGDRLALAPILAPTHADALLFTPRGRQTVPGAVRDLRAALSSLFQPDLLPLFPSDISSYDSTAATMQRLRISAMDLWKQENVPDVAHIQRLGRALNVPYLLVARVTDVEIATGAAQLKSNKTGPPEQADHASRQNETTAEILGDRSTRGTVADNAPDWQREGHAEAVGTLIRVQDGAILWTGRGVADFTSREVVVGADANIQANRHIAEEAIKFALIDLKRRLTEYRSAFEQ